MRARFKDRLLVKQNAAHWRNVLSCPSRSRWARLDCGRSIKKSYLEKLFVFMDLMLSCAQFASYKIGQTVENGFLPISWEEIRKDSGLEKWEIESLSRACRQLGWLESLQAREQLEGGEWFNHISNKRITDKYFEDLGLTKYAKEAKAASLRKIAQDWAKKHNKPVAFFLTPYSLLKKIAQSDSFKGWFEHFKGFDYGQTYSPPYPT